MDSKNAFLFYKFQIYTDFGILYPYFSKNGLYQLLFDQKIKNEKKHKIIVIEGDILNPEKQNKQECCKNVYSHYKYNEIYKIFEQFKKLQNEISLYFSKNLKNFSINIDFSFYSPFQIKVLRELMKINYGETISYKELSLRIGNENAYRAVGHALSQNRTILVIPCHRVINSNGDIGWFGGYGNGKEIKIKFLKHESDKIN